MCYLLKCNLDLLKCITSTLQNHSQVTHGFCKFTSWLRYSHNIEVVAAGQTFIA